MPTAEEVALALGYDYLRRGNFLTATAIADDVADAIAFADAIEEVPSPDRAPFAGLAVEAVGFEEGTDVPSVHLYLTRGTQKLIRELPPEVSGVPIAIHKMGPISVRPDSASTATNQGLLFERSGRICCGSSCGPSSENSAGTIGALVRQGNEQQVYLLSNNHVLGGCNHVPKDQPILAPAAGDGRPGIRAPGEVARHYAIQELRSGSPHFVSPSEMDAALAQATNPNILSSWQGDANGYDTPTLVGAPVSQMHVQKYGRTTGHTAGIIEARVTVPKRIAYNAKFFKGEVWFKDIWTVRSSDPDDPFCLPGDSGSLVVSADGMQAVGLLFAGSKNGEYAWIIPMAQVLGTFGGLQLLGNHGL